MIACIKGELTEALAFLEKGLIKNSHNIKARGLKAVVLRRLGNKEEAKQWALENIRIDGFDYVSRNELILLADSQEEAEIRKADKQRLMRNFQENYLQTARDYAEAGFCQEAVELLGECSKDWPMLFYYKGYYQLMQGKEEEAKAAFVRAEQASPLYCFPNKLEDIAVLKAAMEKNPQGSKAYYYLGNLFYDKLQFEEAIKLWEQSAELCDSFPTVHRNLALAYYNKRSDFDKAREELEKAFALDETDSRVLLELDQLYKKLGTDFEKRLALYENHKSVTEERDDAMLEYVTLYNLLEKPEKAYELIMSHSFRPWEGAEGRISAQYKIALLEMAKKAMAHQNWEKAEGLLEKALVYPENLGEGKLEGTKDNNIYYYLGIVKEHLGKEGAQECFALAELGDNEPAGAMYYYDQPADMILYKGLAKQKLGKTKEAFACFGKLLDYGERHLNDQVKNDFFAVSLPDFLIFEDDMDKRNKAHCYYLMGLANLGLGNTQLAAEKFDQALEYDFNHQNCRIYKALAERK